MPAYHHVEEFVKRFQSMYRSKQRLMQAEIQEIYDGFQAGPDPTDPNLELRRNWHWVNSIVQGWSVLVTDNIHESIWEEANKILARYEQGRVESGRLVSNPD